MTIAMTKSFNIYIVCNYVVLNHFDICCLMLAIGAYINRFGPQCIWMCVTTDIINESNHEKKSRDLTNSGSFEIDTSNFKCYLSLSFWSNNVHQHLISILCKHMFYAHATIIDGMNIPGPRVTTQWYNTSLDNESLMVTWIHSAS